MTIYCPHCDKELTHKTMKCIMRKYEPDEIVEGAAFYVVCPHCKKEISVKKILENV